MQNIFNVRAPLPGSRSGSATKAYLVCTLFQITLEAMKKDEELVAQQAVEFWSTICDVEMDILLEMDEYVAAKEQPPRNCLNYIKGAMKFLIPVLMECLTKQVRTPHPLFSLSLSLRFA
jgi:hypothetical protein